MVIFIEKDKMLNDKMRSYVYKYFMGQLFDGS